MITTQSKSFENFWEIIEKEIHQHPVIISNVYCKWFKRGEASEAQIVDLFEQFAVFSKWFLLAQMMRMLQASDLEAEIQARYILVNELGVGISPDSATENQLFKTSWAHINWLRETAKPLPLDATQLGSWNSASLATRKFIEGLERNYGSKDGNVGHGASYAIETWASWGIGGSEADENNNFWKELISGLEKCNSRRRQNNQPEIPLDFFLFHFNSEKQHGDNVFDELRHSFDKPEFHYEEFLFGARKALEAIHTFWLGLNNARKRIVRC
ncbi:MAG: hypothetical protein G3M70_06865 [Candidatus Nitronauta litoralis]|uniref:Iron-containing redox enzyme family protein n=1 Tax=Candidatus Nitronauta litoralis TaxID=2705533 RepID=A0A7T0G099_9BACT|nr:MAG: hypothetical protein G3M70_06865 [Candidatus Nitronauta litoralis]